MKAKLLKKFRRTARAAIYAEAVYIENKFTGEVKVRYDVWRSPATQTYYKLLQVSVLDGAA